MAPSRKIKADKHGGDGEDNGTVEVCDESLKIQISEPYTVNERNVIFSHNTLGQKINFEVMTDKINTISWFIGDPIKEFFQNINDPEFDKETIAVVNILQACCVVPKNELVYLLCVDMNTLIQQIEIIKVSDDLIKDTGVYPTFYKIFIALKTCTKELQILMNWAKLGLPPTQHVPPPVTLPVIAPDITPYIAPGIAPDHPQLPDIAHRVRARERVPVIAPRARDDPLPDIAHRVRAPVILPRARDPPKLPNIASAPNNNPVNFPTEPMGHRKDWSNYYGGAPQQYTYKDTISGIFEYDDENTLNNPLTDPAVYLALWFMTVPELLLRTRAEANQQRPTETIAIINERCLEWTIMTSKLYPTFGGGTKVSIASKSGTITKKIRVLGRDRNVTKIGRVAYVTYNKELLKLSDARKMDAKKKTKTTPTRVIK